MGRSTLSIGDTVMELSVGALRTLRIKLTRYKVHVVVGLYICIYTPNDTVLDKYER